MKFKFKCRDKSKAVFMKCFIQRTISENSIMEIMTQKDTNSS